MPEKEMTEKETLRDKARGVFDVLKRIENTIGLIGGVVPCEAQEDAEPNGAVDELWILLNDISNLANRIEQASNKIAEKI